MHVHAAAQSVWRGTSIDSGARWIEFSPFKSLVRGLQGGGFDLETDLLDAIDILGAWSQQSIDPTQLTRQRERAFGYSNVIVAVVSTFASFLTLSKTYVTHNKSLLLHLLSAHSSLPPQPDLPCFRLRSLLLPLLPNDGRLRRPQRDEAQRAIHHANHQPARAPLHLFFKKEKGKESVVPTTVTDKMLRPMDLGLTCRQVVGWPWGRRPETKSSERAKRRRRFALPLSTPSSPAVSTSLDAVVTGPHRSTPITVVDRRRVFINIKAPGGWWWDA